MSAECDNPPVAEASNPAEGNEEVLEEGEKGFYKWFEHKLMQKKRLRI